MTFLIRLLMAGIFFSTQYTFAAPELAQEKFAKDIIKRLNESKTIAEFVNGTAGLSSKQKSEMITWMNGKGVDALKNVSATFNGSDMIFVDDSGKKNKLTLTDYKRGITHINDKKVSINDNKSISENLDAIYKMIQEKKSASLFFPRAEALGLLAIVAIIALVALICGLVMGGKSKESVVENIKELVEDAGIKEMDLGCNETYPHANSDKAQYLSSGTTLTIRTADGGDFSQLKIESHPGGHQLIMESTIEKNRRGELTQSDESVKSELSTKNKALLEIAKKCCALNDCASLLKSSVPGLTPLGAQSGGKRSSSGAQGK